MKRILILALFALCFCSSAFALSYTNIYTVAASTRVVTDTVTYNSSFDYVVSTTSLAPLIKKTPVRIKSFSILNSSDVAQTVKVYRSATSTTTVSLAASWDIPAAKGIYYPFGYNALDEDTNFSCSNFFVNKSTTASEIIVTMLYK